MILPVVAFSAALGLFGLYLAIRAGAIGWRAVLTAAAVLAGSVAIWLPVQALVHSY
jgi:hypothetical protein